MIQFFTSQGSSYNFCPATSTSIRTKRSGGSGQGRVHKRQACVFFDTYVNPVTHKIVIGYLEGERVIPIYSTAEAGNEKIGMVSISRESGEVKLYQVFLHPAHGLRPYEWDKKRRHIGNVIVEIRR